MPKLQNKNKTVLLTKRFSFDAAHKLTQHRGKCKNLHGHTYFLEVTICGTVNHKSGMVMDFGDIKEIVENSILKKLDHRYINDVIKISTAENIISWIWDELSEKFQECNIGLYELKLWENPSSFVTYQLQKYEN